jgi:Aminotransferase class-V
VGKALDREGIAVRAGHHCAQPILRRFRLESAVRPSLALYNNRADVDALVLALLRLTSRKDPRALALADVDQARQQAQTLGLAESSHPQAADPPRAHKR